MNADPDPELGVTLSDGEEAATFQIAPAAVGGDTWLIVEPGIPLAVVVGRAEALAVRERLDAAIAARLSTGWVPMGMAPLAPRVAPTPLPPDLHLHLSRLLEVLDHERTALCAADPSGRLWAACQTLLRHGRRFDVAMPGARRARAQRERRLGECAEHAGDIPAALLHYRAALAAHAGVGVRRRLARLVAYERSIQTRSSQTARDGAIASLARPPARRAALPIDRVPEVAAPSCVPFTSDPVRPHAGGRGSAEETTIMPKKVITTAATKKAASVQLVCRIDATLNAQVRAHAERAGQTLTTFVARALTAATAPKPPATRSR